MARIVKSLASVVSQDCRTPRVWAKRNHCDPIFRQTRCAASLPENPSM
jgi:hypothetical protein